MVNIPEWFTDSDLNFCPCGMPMSKNMVIITDDDGDRFMMHPECLEMIEMWDDDED